MQRRRFLQWSLAVLGSAAAQKVMGQEKTYSQEDIRELEKRLLGYMKAEYSGKGIMPGKFEIPPLGITEYSANIDTPQFVSEIEVKIDEKREGKNSFVMRFTPTTDMGEIRSVDGTDVYVPSRKVPDPRNKRFYNDGGIDGSVAGTVKINGSSINSNEVVIQQFGRDLESVLELYKSAKPKK